MNLPYYWPESDLNLLKGSTAYGTTFSLLCGLVAVVLTTLLRVCRDFSGPTAAHRRVLSKRCCAGCQGTCIRLVSVCRLHCINDFHRHTRTSCPLASSHWTVSRGLRLLFCHVATACRPPAVHPSRCWCPCWICSITATYRRALASRRRRVFSILWRASVWRRDTRCAATCDCVVVVCLLVGCVGLVACLYNVS